MTPCDTPTSSPASSARAVAQIKLEIKLLSGETKKGELTSHWQSRVFSESRGLIAATETLILYANDNFRVGRDHSHK